MQRAHDRNRDRRRRRRHRRPHRRGDARQRRASTSSCSRRATGSAGASGTPRSAVRRTSSAASGSRRTSRRCTRCSRARDRALPELPRGRARLHRSRRGTPPLRRPRRAARRRRPSARSPRRRRSSTRSPRSSTPRRHGHHPDARELDSITFEAWLRREVGDEIARRTCCARGSRAASWRSPPIPSRCLQGLWMIAGAGGTYELFEPDQCLAYRVVGGSQLIPIRLAERLGDRVLLGAPARDISWSDDGGRDLRRGRRGARAGGDRRRAAEPHDRDPLSSGAARLAPAARPIALAGLRSTRSWPSTSDRSGATRGSRARGSRPTSSCASSTTTRRRRPAPGCSPPSSPARTPSAPGG